MKGFFRLTTWAGPLTIGSFAVVATTGIMMFFHWNVGLSKLAHEWLGWLLVIGGLAHLAVNWRPFLAYFRRPAGVGIMAVLWVVGALALVPAGGPSHQHPMMRVSRALEESSLNLVAQVAKRSPQSASDSLTARGIRIASLEQTIAQIASANARPAIEVLACVLGETGKPASERRGR
jgi:hypothetical protein